MTGASLWLGPGKYIFLRHLTRNRIITPNHPCSCLPERDHLAITIGVSQVICSRPNLYTVRGRNTMYFSGVIQICSPQEFLFIGDRLRKLKTFEAAAWPPPIARKPGTDVRFIVNALLFFVVGRLVSCNGQLCSGTETSMWNQVRLYFANLIWRGSSTVIFDRLAQNVHVKTNGSHSALGLLVQLFQPLLLVEVRALITLGASAKFSVQSELNDFFGFFRLAVANETGHNLFFFPKAFQPILRHLLRDKMTPRYLVMCFMTSRHTSYSRMTGLVSG